MRTFIIAMLLLTTCPLNAQILDDICGTSECSNFSLRQKPWYGNNSYLYNILDSSGYFNNTFNLEKVLYRVPVKFWVYRDTKASGGTTEAEIRKFMIDLNINNIQNNTGFVYYLQGIGFINNDRHRIASYYSEAPWLTLKNKSAGAINVHIFDAIKKKKLFGKSRSNINGTYNKATKGITMQRNASSTSLAHEIGHFFGLEHPHRHWQRGKRKQEAVSRTRKQARLFSRGLNCEQNGDGLCDTPAEPNLDFKVSENCIFTDTTLTDNWGDLYKPATNNIMSYPSNRDCRNKFTAGQVAVMIFTAKKVAEKAWDASTKINGELNLEHYFDAYEPDNTALMASEIDFNSKQYRTFHKTYLGKNKSSDVDEDWLTFNLNIPTNLVVITTSKGEFAAPDTEIFLYDYNNALIGSDKNSGGGTFSKLKAKNLKKGKYFIKVIKHNKISAPKIADYNIEISKTDNSNIN